MLDRLRRTIAILRAPTRAPDRYEVGISRAPDYDEVTAERQGQSGVAAPSHRNPAVMLIELTIIVLVSVYIIGPILNGLFRPQSEEGGSLLVSIATGVFSLIWIHALESVHGRIATVIRLDFLDPYFGRRLKRTIQALRNRA